MIRGWRRCFTRADRSQAAGHFPTDPLCIFWLIRPAILVTRPAIRKCKLGFSTEGAIDNAVEYASQASFKIMSCLTHSMIPSISMSRRCSSVGCIRLCAGGHFAPESGARFFRSANFDICSTEDLERRKYAGRLGRANLKHLNF